MQNNEVFDEPKKIGNLFNAHFTSLKSNSLSTASESENFIDATFKDLKDGPNPKIKDDFFSFSYTTEIIVEKLLKKLDVSSGAGISDIPTKLIKSNTVFWAYILTKLINKCIELKQIPGEFKTAIVTPLYKKGDKMDLNNYRGISVICPAAKIFEKIIATQIIIFFNTKKKFYNGQHGFRSDHSCETALHELLSDLNKIKSKKMIALLLFIDYRKAFDLVDSKILLRKLFHYGFDRQSIDLIANYFINRKQTVKVNKIKSDFCDLDLGVGQGTITGSLFFLIFINDLAFTLDLECKMFADDTTLYTSGNDLNTLLTSFKKKLEKLFAWCNFNKLDINWSKTFFMFITNKRINKELPTKIQVDNILVDVVTDFKLLGITIDNKLNFEKYTTQLRAIINRKLYSIKRIFYLNRAVKLQFFKTFILPYFDYCLSLFIYFPKASIQRINNAYYICLDKLFKFKMEQHDALNDGFCDIKDDINESIVDENSDIESDDINNRKKIINKERILEFNALLTGSISSIHFNSEYSKNS